MAQTNARKVLAREVQRALSASGLTVAAASRKMKVEPKRIYRWLNGEVSPRLDEVERFAVAIGQPMRLVLGHDESAAPRMEERLEDIERWLRAIAVVTGVEPEVIAELEQRVAELERVRLRPDGSHQTVDPLARDE